MRRRGRVDDNQSTIVRDLRAIGATVEVLSGVGGGCPDLLIGFRGANYLAEVKDPTKPPSDRRLTPDQRGWHADWRGQRQVIETSDDAFEMIGAAKRRQKANDR